MPCHAGACGDPKVGLEVGSQRKDGPEPYCFSPGEMGSRGSELHRGRTVESERFQGVLGYRGGP